MDLMNLEYLKLYEYRVSWKADGTRYLMYINGKNDVFMLDRDNSVFRVQNLTFPKRKEPEKHLENTLLDGVSKYLFFNFSIKVIVNLY